MLTTPRAILLGLGLIAVAIVFIAVAIVFQPMARYAEIIGGAIVLSLAAFALWGIARITKSYWRGGEWKGRHIAAVAASAAIAAGLLLATKWSWVDRDTFGLGFLLALAGGVTLSAIGYTVDRK